ncbi:MAG TPA: sulfotransferase domain-containing protein, partial [Chitinophagales bacterium]|nr:sulfotransferase domain-containing protein [Chitinophagales bacterium]
ATYVFVELSKKYQNQFYLLNYDDLLNDVNLTINRVFSFCELDVPIQTYNFINPKTTINQQDAYSVFKSKKEDNEWVEKLSQSIIEEIKKDNDFQKLNECFKWI